MYENKKQKHETVSYKMYETENRIRKTIFVKRVKQKVQTVFVKHFL